MRNKYGTMMLSEMIAKLTEIHNACGDIPVTKFCESEPYFPDDTNTMELNVLSVVSHPRCQGFVNARAFDKISEPLQTELKGLGSDSLFIALEIKL